MDINIRFETNVPLSGYAGPRGGPSSRFVGWLGLLRVLSEVVGSTSALAGDVRKLAAGRESELEEDVRDVGFHGTA